MPLKYSNNNIIALVPCRAGSERVINKNTRPFADSSLLEIKINQLLNVPMISRVVISTNDAMVVDIAKRFRQERVEIVPRESYYASSKCTTDELIAYFARTLDFNGHILWTHVTSPFITEDVYTQAIKVYFRNLDKYDSLMSVYPLKEFVWDQSRKHVNYGSYKGNWPKTQDLETLYHINSGIFLISLYFMRKFNDRVGLNPYFFECSEIQSLDVDYEDDFKVCEKLWKALKKHASPFTL